MSKPPTRRPRLYIVNLQVSPGWAERLPVHGEPGGPGDGPSAVWGGARSPCCAVAPQWTPKDDLAALKLHGRCDDVMRLLMAELGLEIPRYDR